MYNTSLKLRAQYSYVSLVGLLKIHIPQIDINYIYYV